MRKRFFVSGLAIVALATLCVFALRSKALRSHAQPVTVQTPTATVKIFNNTINNAWVNVPIEIASLGTNNYRVTNKTKMTIKQFLIALRAPDVGQPFHVADAHQHRVLVHVKDQPLEPGKFVDINIEKHLAEFSSGAHSAHGHKADAGRVEMMAYAVDFDDKYGGKRWLGGKYLRPTANNEWEEDPDLNPKESNLIGASSPAQSGCYVYGYPVSKNCLQCNTGDLTCDTPFCKRPVFNFKSNRGGVHLAQTCYSCSQIDGSGNCDIFGTICAHGDGSPCNTMVPDLDYNNPC